MDEYTIMTPGGVKGPTWRCDDAFEAEAIAREHGYDVVDIQDMDGFVALVVKG